MNILDVFCSVDEFWQTFAPGWELQLPSGRRRRGRPAQLHPSEIMTILIWFHCSHYRTFKAYYLEYVQTHLRGEFATQVSYPRFVFVDSTPLEVCHPARISDHRVFAGNVVAA